MSIFSKDSKGGESPYVIDVAIVGVGIKGRSAVKSLSLDYLLDKNSVISGLVSFTDDDAFSSESSLECSFFNERRKEIDLLYCICDTDEEGAIEKACRIGCAFKGSAYEGDGDFSFDKADKAKKFSLCVLRENGRYADSDKLRECFDSVVFVDSHSSLLTPFYTLYVDMQAVGLVSMDYSDVDGEMRKIGVGYYFSRHLDLDFDYAALSEALSPLLDNRLRREDDFDLPALVNISIPSVDCGVKIEMLIDTLEKESCELIWSLNTDEYLDDKIKVDILFGV